MKPISAMKLMLTTLIVINGCKPRTFNTSVQSVVDSGFSQQFEVTRFTVCQDSKGRESGGLDFVWRLRKSTGESVTPYILGYAGSAETVDGQKVEFRSVSTIDEPRYVLPAVKPAGSFPVMNYLGVSLQYPDAELKSGWGFFKINGKDAKFTDVTGGLLAIPKNKDAGSFASRYFIVTSDGKTLEFNCQPVTDAIRERMKTYLVKDGSHGFKGERGPVVASYSPTPTPVPTSPSPQPSSPTHPAISAELRPANRPASYDAQFLHERIFDCGANGAVDVIWRKATSAGTPLSIKEQYILGFAAQLRDSQTGKSVGFSSVSVDSAPAFFVGSKPQPVGYLSPAFLFSADEVNSKMSYHTPITGLAAGRSIAVGGTLWIPTDGSGNGVSVAIATGVTLRGDAFQVSADCKPLVARIPQLINGCVGRETSGTCQR